MADKKITALTELSATAKAGEDFLHIIDYGGGSSPVNKRISLTNLFSKINLDTHIYGTSKTFEIGSTDSASSAFKVTTTDTTTLTTAKQNEVVVNDDQSRHIDFTVKSAQSAGAIKVESDYTSGNSGPGIVFINSDAGNQDFCVKGDGFTGANPSLFSDASADALGIGTNVVDAAYKLTIATGSTGSIKAAGGVDVTGNITATGNASVTGNLTVTGFLTLNDAIATAIAGGANVGAKVEIPITDLVTHLDPGSSTGHYGLANGAAGQFKILYNSDAAEVATITPTTFAQGANITMQAKEPVMLMYTTGGWIILGHYGVVVA